MSDACPEPSPSPSLGREGNDSAGTSLSGRGFAIDLAAGGKALSPLRERAGERVACRRRTAAFGACQSPHRTVRPSATTTPTPVRAPGVITTIITEEKLEPPYVLILHNDPVNTMAHVMQSLTHCVPTLSHEEAFEIMMQAHDTGKARVIVAPHEEASRYRNCLESRGLTATIEPAYD